jgi:hypothetical protein
MTSWKGTVSERSNRRELYPRLVAHGKKAVKGR